MYKRQVQTLLESYNSTPLKSGTTLAELIRRPELSYEAIKPLDKERPELPWDVQEQVDINIKYDGYIRRQLKQVEQFKKLEAKKIPKMCIRDRCKGYPCICSYQYYRCKRIYRYPSAVYHR